VPPDREWKRSESCSCTLKEIAKRCDLTALEVSVGVEIQGGTGTVINNHSGIS
jgi:hypothetical protein